LAHQSLQHSTAQHNTAQHSATQHSTVQNLTQLSTVGHAVSQGLAVSTRCGGRLVIRCICLEAQLAHDHRLGGGLGMKLRPRPLTTRSLFKGHQVRPTLKHKGRHTTSYFLTQTHTCGADNPVCPAVVSQLLQLLHHPRHGRGAAMCPVQQSLHLSTGVISGHI
jgi:hypothetical protein